MCKIFPSKDQFRKWSLPSRLGYIGFWIAIIGVPAVLITYFTLIKNFIDRNPEILEVKPFVYIDQREDLKYKDWPAPTDLGLFFIVHIKNGSRVSTINGLKIKTDKYYLDLNDYFTLHKNIGKIIDEIEKEWKEKIPYYSIDWDAYLSDKNQKKVLFPHDEAYIGIVLLDPIINGQSESEWQAQREKYVGYENDTIVSKITRKYPEFGLIFKDFNINKLPPKKIRQELDFYLLVNDKELFIEKSLFTFIDRVNKHEYDNDSFEKMFLRYYAE